MYFLLRQDDQGIYLYARDPNTACFQGLTQHFSHAKWHATNIKVISDSKPPKRFNFNKPKTEKPVKKSTGKSVKTPEKSNESKKITETTE